MAGRWKEFPYDCRWKGNVVTARPLLEVELTNNGITLPFSALLDTGTDSVLMNMEIADALRINVTPCKEVAVTGVGNAKGRICEVDFSLPAMNFRMAHMPVIFVRGVDFDILLGQRHFLEAFDARFERKKFKFYLRKS